MVELLFTLGFCFIFAIVCFNIAPFIDSDTWGHYLRIKEKHYVYSIKENDGSITIHNKIVFEMIKEKCNPWLNFWNLVKIKPGIIEYEFDSEETKELWNKIQ